MQIGEAQADMRRAFVGGATGILASGLAWLTAAACAHFLSPRAGIAALFFGGMLIHPVAILLSRLLGSSGAPAPDNPLTALAIQTTVWMLLAIPLAYALSWQRTEWFFVGMLVTIGGRYLTFVTLYGLRTYAVCGVALAATAFVLAAVQAGGAVVALAGGILEVAFAALVFARLRVMQPAPGSGS
jgi:hypothetical protein